MLTSHQISIVAPTFRNGQATLDRLLHTCAYTNCYCYRLGWLHYPNLEAFESSQDVELIFASVWFSAQDKTNRDSIHITVFAIFWLRKVAFHFCERQSAFLLVFGSCHLRIYSIGSGINCRSCILRRVSVC